MQSQLTHILAQQHIADLHRDADHNRLVHTATSSHAVPAPGQTAAAPVPFLGWLRRRRASPVPGLAPPPSGLNAPVAPER
jgi:hypothetical protein